MTSELMTLVWVTALTGVLWIPYILNTIVVRGIMNAVGYPVDPKPLAAWAARLKCAHYNAVENLVIFATLVLVAHAVGVSNETTVLACTVYFWARLVHVFAYSFAVPWLRTVAFVVGFVCQAALVWELI